MHIDHDFNVNAAKGAKEAGIKHYSLLSAATAKVHSCLLYPKCKGLIENDVKELNFDSLDIFEPGLLERGAMSRWNESVLTWIIHSTPVESVAHAMRLIAGMNSCVFNDD